MAGVNRSRWVSKEALPPQEWSQLCHISLKYNFRAKNVNILISNFSLVFFRDILCIIEVWGAQWIWNVHLWYLWKPHQIYPQTSMNKNNFGYSILWKLWDTLLIQQVLTSYFSLLYFMLLGRGQGGNLWPSFPHFLWVQLCAESFEGCEHLF